MGGVRPGGGGGSRPDEAAQPRRAVEPGAGAAPCDSSPASAVRPLVLCIMGPTGSGKSALAQALARRVPAEIVSVDSVMIYRGMDVGTDKPAPAVRARIPHHLVDICDPAERYSAGAFARDAAAAVRGIVARGRLPVLVGGTFLYFRALTAGLAPMPPANAAVRARIRARAEAGGWAALHAELARVDPRAAERIAPADAQRLERALELWYLTGEAPSRLHARDGAPVPWRFLKLALWPRDRAALGHRLDARFRAMLARGLVEEVRALHARGDLDASYPAARALGYRQLWQWLDGESDLEEAVQRAVVATRRYAKRQLTWLRGEADTQAVPAGAGALAAVLERLAHARGERRAARARVLP